MPSPPEDRLRERAHALFEQLTGEPLECTDDWHYPTCDAIVAFALAERADAAREAEAATWDAADKMAGDRAKEWAAQVGEKRTHANARMAGRAVEAAELSVLFDHRSRAAREAPVTPGKGTP